MGKPLDATKKKLFALSGNKCAFPGCVQKLVDKESGAVIANICHIKGNKPGSKRYDENQSENDRQSFDNLLVLCPSHHDVIDNDENTFSVAALKDIKQSHESRAYGQFCDDKEAEELFLDKAIVGVSGNAIANSINQSGGQTANFIVNVGARSDSASNLNSELVKRNLANPDDLQFGKTIYHKRMGYTKGNAIEKLRVSGLLFARTKSPILPSSRIEELMKWMNANELKIEPCKWDTFIPCLIPDLSGSNLIWSNGGLNARFASQQVYSRYLAFERTGWIEYGFDPINPLEEMHKVYYATVIANVVGFLNFVKTVANQFNVLLSDVDLGFAMLGIKDSSLVCLGNSQPVYSRMTLPDQNNCRWLREAISGNWESSDLAHEIAEMILNLWEYSRPGYVLDTPEFKNGEYEGAFFREKIRSW